MHTVHCRVAMSTRAGTVNTVNDFKLSYRKTFDEDARTDIYVYDANGNPLTPSDTITAGLYTVTTNLEGTQHNYEVQLDQVANGLPQHSITRKQIS